jgi:DNA-binding transcriptional LysR family regulator
VDLLAAMQTFVRVVNAGSLSRAARALDVSPAAVSRQLTSLEAELGAVLLVRTTRALAVTEEGRRFYEAAERTVNEAEEARASVRADRATSGRLTVSAPTALGLGRLDLSLVSFLAENPGLRVDLRLEDHPVDLLAEGVDVAIRAGLELPDSTIVVAQPIAESPRVVVAAPAYVRRRGEPKHPSELVEHDAVLHLPTASTVNAWVLRNGEQSKTFEVRGAFRASALHALRNVAVAGGGITLLPRFLVADDIAKKRLRVLHLGGWAPREQRIYALLRAESRSRARVRAFLAHLRERLMSEVEA